MGLLITPRDFAHRAELYHQLAQLTSAGVGLIAGLKHIERAPPTRPMRWPLRRILERLEAGETFSEALEATGKWMPAFDVALLRAGEQSGRLDACFRLLADYYLDRAQLARRVIGELVYPAFLLHFAVFILAAPQYVLTGNTTAYLASTFGVLIPIYVLVLITLYAGQARHGRTWRAIIEGITRFIPGVGKTRQCLALARLSAALEALISAGFPIFDGWELAAAASGSPAIERAVRKWKPKLLAGQTPAEVLKSSPQFPELFTNLYSSGEVSGKLDEALHQLYKIYLEEGVRRAHLLAQWIPRLIYVGIVLWIAYQIIKFWTGYFGRLGEVGGF